MKASTIFTALFVGSAIASPAMKDMNNMETESLM